MTLASSCMEREVRTDTGRDLRRRVQTEYADMPGLSLTLRQAQRLWATDRPTCEAVFRQLIASGLLRLTTRGRFVRADLCKAPDGTFW